MVSFLAFLHSFNHSKKRGISRRLGKLEKYQYDPLPSEEYVRILELLPGVQGDQLQCNLTQERRKEAENTFDAISYVWGDPNNNIEILCCGKPMSITVGLADALRAIRKETESQRLWADAISIDQASDVEKGHQVKRMGNVFASARQVFVWLGNDKDGIAEDCFNLIVETNKVLDPIFETHNGINSMPLMETPYPISTKRSRWAKVEKLLESSWFKRVWVIQEAALAPKCLLLWGNQMLSIADLMELVAYLAYRKDICQITLPNNLTVSKISTTFYFIQSTYTSSNSWRTSKPLIAWLSNRSHTSSPTLFLDILQQVKGYKATDPRDRVYAFLGHPLATFEDRTLLIEPDYTLEVEEVYFNTACALLRKTNEAPYVLCNVIHDNPGDIMGSKLPSWVPQWELKDNQLGNPVRNFQSWFKCGGPVNRLQHQISRGRRSERFLTAQGFFFDKIIWTSERLEGNYFMTDASFFRKFLNSKYTYIDMLWNQVSDALKRIEKMQISTQEGDFAKALVCGYPSNKTMMYQHQSLFKSYQKVLQVTRSSQNNSLTSKEKHDSFLYERYLGSCHLRRLAVTAQGLIGIVPELAEIGDSCCVLLGMVAPFILRPAKSGRYNLVGECYIQGVMDGELVEKLDAGDYQEEAITLV